MNSASLGQFEPDLAGAEVCAAVNVNERVTGKPVDIILLHYTGMKSAQGAIDWLVCAESKVSCHYFIREDGSILQLVPEHLRAWHAGASIWQGETDINSRSIGVEIANPGHDFGYPDFAPAQIDAVIELCRNCGDRHGIPPERVLAHSDVAPQRKQDPGEKFPWATLYAAGVGHWVEPAAVQGGRFFQEGDRGQPVEALQSMLSLYGYGTEITGEFCPRTKADVVAFQRHFRPKRVDGIADISTIETLHRLLRALPKYTSA